MRLITTPNLPDHDDIYQQIVDLHQDLKIEDSLKANAKLVLLLANHIGDSNIVKEAIEIVAQQRDGKQSMTKVADCDD